MPVDALRELVIELLVAVHALTGYALPDAQPVVEFVPHASLEHAACDRPCDIYGWYPFGAVVYLDDRLAPLSGIQAQGVLLHELVHFVQHHNHAYASETPCMGWALREREAVMAQARWLRDHGESLPMAAVGPPVWALACRDEDVSDKRVR